MTKNDDDEYDKLSVPEVISLNQRKVYHPRVKSGEGVDRTVQH